MSSTNHKPTVPDGTLQEMFIGPSIPKDPGSRAYLDHLTTLDLQTLLSEPTVLQTQSHHLTSSITSLTHTSYPTFIALHEATQSLGTSLDSLSQTLDSLVSDSLPNLETSVADWRGATKDVLAERHRARVVLEQHDKIRDLLDIPLLIDTCVRNGYFQEALSLASHATSLAASSQNKVPSLLLTSVLSEVQNSVTQMLLTLLATLHEPNRKPLALFKAVSFLRKMEAFQDSGDEGQVEEKIALAFLTGREACFKVSQEGLSRDISRLAASGVSLDEREEEDLARYLNKYIDLWRDGVYEIITQYSTIFLGKSPYSAQSGARSPSVVSPASKQTFGSPISVASLHRLISTYASHALTSHLLPILQSSLPRLPTSSLSSLLTQLTYRANIFARVGLDFRGILPSLFEPAVLAAFRRDLQKASNAWSNKVRNASGSTLGDDAKRVVVSPLSPSKRKSIMQTITQPSRWLAPPSVLLVSLGGSLSTSVTSPPQILTSFPPLAEYTNDVLTALNNLRMLAPVSLRFATLQLLDDALVDAGTQMLQYIKLIVSSSISSGDSIEEKSAKEVEQEVIVRKAGEAFYEVVLPYLRTALTDGVYGSVEESLKDWKLSEKLDDVQEQWKNWKVAAVESLDKV
ncbi:Dor1-like family-domain-containing protein [Flagelloscypha sp. PMI_526]|nr:Dor1-like family-domain-containing protein [Flagelloscypha sp. PMI_526]